MSPAVKSIITCDKQNEISSHALPVQQAKDSNIISREIALIENNTISMVNKNSPLCQIKSVGMYLKKVTCQLLRQNMPLPIIDPELDEILAQGRIYAHDADAAYYQLNESSNITKPVTLSLTSKTGMVLGGILATSALIGTGFYYAQRANRKFHHKTSPNTTEIDQRMTSLQSGRAQYPFYSSPQNEVQNTLPDSQVNILSLKETIHHKAKKTAVIKYPRWKAIKAKNKAKPHQAKKLSRCPTTGAGWKVPRSIPYHYSTQQPEVCLTVSFNQRCQIAHQQSRNKKGCSAIPTNMILKISSVFCYCPPPDGLKMTIVAIPSSSGRRHSSSHTIARPPSPITPTHTSPHPTQPEKIKVIVYPDDREMFKHRLSESYAYYLPPKMEPSLLLSGTTPSPIAEEEEQGVKHVSLIKCHTKRENLTAVDIYRIISETIDNPIHTILREGQIIIQYDYLNQGCIDNSEIYDITKKIGSVIENLLSWIPGYNRVQFITRVISTILRALSDYLDGKEIDVEEVIDLQNSFLGFSKDILSTANTRSINEMSKNTAGKKEKDFLSSFEYKEDALIINTGSHGRHIKTEKKLNHLADAENNGFVFYDYEKKWSIDNDIKSNNHIRDTFKKSRDTWKDEENIYFFKNSSPNLYADAILLRYHGEIYTLVNNELHRTNEIQLTDSVFRYTLKDNHEDLPIIYKGESWYFEEKISPVVSPELKSFLINNDEITKKLVSSHINHQDVSPLTPGRNTQFDKHHNEYIKINNNYYKLTKSKDTSYYIESSHDLLALQLIDDKFHIKKSFFDDICCFHKEPINTIPDVNQNDMFFLDNSVTSAIASTDFWSHNNNFLIFDDHHKVHLTKSENIDGAVVNNGFNYIYYKNKLIKIHSNDDDSYILGDTEDNNKNIKLYKNPESNTYLKASKKINKWSGLIRRKDHCIVKRQPLSACHIEFFETTRIRHILSFNSNHGIIIDNYLDTLDTYDNFPAIYNEKNDKTALYYKGEGNIFFHLRKSQYKAFSLTPTQFVIYGKNEDQQINLKYVLSSISIIKDFDTKKMIISTPEEAQKNVFDINIKFSELFLKWQEEDKIYQNVSPDDLQNIVKNTPRLHDLSDMNELFNRSGKKVIASVEDADKILKHKIDQLLLPNSILEMHNLSTLESTKNNPTIQDICSQAFKKTIFNIRYAAAALVNSEKNVDNYILNVLKITDFRARKIFINSLKSKLERMWMIFDEDNKDNIIIMFKKVTEEKSQEILSEEGKNTLGFTVLNDPLDRIFINTAVIADSFESVAVQTHKNIMETAAIPQPDTPKRNRIFFINLISETMLHEAVHALGSPEDYLYLHINRDGYIESTRDSIHNIEHAILEGEMNNIKFEYLSKLYFMSNPLYKDYTITSLIKPKILHRIFQEDSFFRAIVLLNNPDTISLLIREFANSPRLPE